jgi:hypothetical protein
LLPLGSGHGILVTHEIAYSSFPAKREIHAKKPARTPPGQCERSLTKRFAWHRAKIEAGAADVRVFFDERNAMTEDGRSVGAAGASGTTADDNEVEVSLGHRPNNSNSLLQFSSCIQKIVLRIPSVFASAKRLKRHQDCIHKITLLFMNTAFSPAMRTNTDIPSRS